MKRNFIYLLLVGIVIIFLIESQLDLIQISYGGSNLRGEISFIELIQNFFLITILIITIKFKKLLVKFYNNLSFILRVSFVSIILYEEISFITYGMSEFFNSLNYQNEINFHNSNFFGQRIYFENINLLFAKFDFSVTYHFLLYALILLVIGYGTYLPIFKKFRLFFLERKNSIYCLLYFFIELINSILRDINLTDGKPLINHEFLELGIYVLLLKDTLDKIKSIKQKI